MHICIILLRIQSICPIKYIHIIILRIHSHGWQTASAPPHLHFPMPCQWDVVQCCLLPEVLRSPFFFHLWNWTEKYYFPIENFNFLSTSYHFPVNQPTPYDVKEPLEPSNQAIAGDMFIHETNSWWAQAYQVKILGSCISRFIRDKGMVWLI